MKHIQIASLKKRLLSSLIDLGLIAGLFCLFYFCVFTKAVSSVQHYDHLNEVIKNEKIISGLYIGVDNKAVSLLDYYSKPVEGDLEPPTHTFYINYLYSKDKKYDEYWYDVHVLYLDDIQEKYNDVTYPKETLFKWVDETDWHEGYERKEEYEDDQDLYDKFYRTAYLNATTKLESFNPIKDALLKMSWGNIRAVVYSSLVATFIPCFIIPITLKNGKTVGKLVTKLVVLTDEGYEYKRYKHIFRYLAFYIFEVFGGVITIGLTLILTTSLTFFTKKRRALHDYIAFSVVADEVNSVFYKDVDEEMMYQKKSLEKLKA